MARNSRTKATHSTGNNRSEHHVSPESSPHNRAGPTRSIAHAPTVRSQAHETLKTMTTIIMRTSEGDMRMMLLLWDATPGNRSLKIVEIPIKTTLNNPDFPEK